MEQIAPCEYTQKRLGRSEHNHIIPKRWYESGYYDNVKSFLESVIEMDCDEMFEYIEEKYADVVVRLEVEEENERAVHVYKKAGYEVLPYMEMIRK